MSISRSSPGHAGPRPDGRRDHGQQRGGGGGGGGDTCLALAPDTVTVSTLSEV